MKETQTPLTNDNAVPEQDLSQEIAVVGMSLRFPGADNKAAFWHNLVNKVNSITEIPTDRWDWHDDYDPAPKKDDQKTLSKWGGFIENIDTFDAAFFAISPVEAKNMDPQQRLSMELAWACFEDAGFAPEYFKNSKTGVYVGCSNTDYQEFTKGNIEAHFLTGMSTGVFANRISHYFNLHGPSLTVDTACSSSLVAIHKAIKDFKMGEINAALVGGVNLLITKGRYISFSKLGVLSPNGRCKTLDADADGYVRGEGVGMVLLLPLEKALEENATIYGIIKGSSVSHSGKTKTLTSPNPFSQSRAIQDAQEAAGVTSDQVSYIELHGTGTRLGDPIEIQGLKRAFRATKAPSANPDNRCHLTTVKTNIGHLEPAAGIAGLIKVLLSFDHNQIPPLQNFEQLNPKISLDKSPFELVTDAKDWPAGEQPRIAGISSFGFAGVNSHVIVQEPPKPQTISAAKAAKTNHFALILSAKNEKALHRRAAQLLSYLQSGQLQDSNIENLVYTLQVGRTSMKHRFGFITSTMADIQHQLQLFLDNQSGNWLLGKEDSALNGETNGQDTNGIESSDESDLSTALLSDWIDGYSVDWKLLYSGKKPQRISLPAYPFAGKRYWIAQKQHEYTPLSKSALHPLLHESLPSLNELAFVSRFSGNEFFLKDHIVNKQAILPGVCSLEMVSEAMLLSHIVDDNHSIVFDKVNWLRPILVKKDETPQEVFLSLWQREADIGFEIWSKPADEYVIYTQGQVSLTEQEKPTAELSIKETLSENKTTQSLDANDVYRLFGEAGIEYGPSFQGVQNIERLGNESVAKVKVADTFCQDFGFSPALLDAALQTLVVFAKQGDLALPFAVEHVEFHHSMPEEVLVKAKQVSNDGDIVQKFDVDICDLEGNVCVRFNSFSTRAISADELAKTDDAKGQKLLPVAENSSEALYTLKPTWLSKAVVSQSTDTLSTLKTAYLGPKQLKPAALVDFDGKAEHLIWIADGELADPLALFKHIKSLLDEGYGAESFALTLVTLQTQQVHFEQSFAQGAGLIGLTQSLAQEYPRWNIRIVDVEKDKTINWHQVYSLSPGFYAIRDNECYSFEVAAHEYQDFKPTAYKNGGVYLVLGGAGGLGQVWSEWMARNFDAQIVWVGRREENESIKTALARLSSISGTPGKKPIYYSADAGDLSAITAVIEDIKTRFGNIDGVVHSILHLEDQSLANMTEQQFMRSYRAKQQTGDVLIELFKNEALDFLLLFSSLQSFSPAAGQSNYAAGCHYLDSLALSQQNNLPIKIINWGYWGSVGIVRDDFYHKKMQQAGIGSIEADEGMQLLAQFLRSSLPQVGAVKMQQAQFAQAAKHQSFSTEKSALSVTAATSAIDYRHQTILTDEDILPSLCHALHKAGWSLPEQREKALAALPNYFNTWWQATADYLTSNQLLVDGRIADTIESNSIGEEHQLLRTCLSQLSQILSGERKATDVVFPSGSLHLVETVYQQNAVADYANQVLVEQLRQYLSAMNLPSVSLLEVGAGTGGTTRSVLPALNDWRIDEYAYTDLSKAFFNHAKSQFQPDYPFVQTKYFDVSNPLVSQDIPLGAYDVVIATNVLHATADIRETLKNAKACLKPGGVLLINEVVEKSLFTQLTFGLLEGWWLSEDKSLRIKGSPMLSLNNWQRVLREAGFINVHAATDKQSPQQIFSAVSNGQILQAVAHKQTGVKKPSAKTTSEPKPTQSKHNSANVHTFVQQTLFEVASNTLSIEQDELDAEESYADYGVDSILAVQMLEEINDKFELSLPATLLFDYPSIATLSNYIATEHKAHVQQFVPTETLSTASVSEPAAPESNEPIAQNNPPQFNAQPQAQDDAKIAIVGMSGQFGSATDVDEFWSMIINKETSCTEQSRWDLTARSEKEQGWGRYASLLDDISLFDAGFFSITPQEAMYMDPQQRLFLQECYKALEDANMTTEVAGEQVGVYLGCAQGDYANLASEDAPAQIFWGNAGSVIPARVSYFLNLKGPAIAIDTACSSSLVALHMATQALSKHEISSALVGGVATLCTPKFSNHAGKAGMLSPDGTCYTFDDRANGFVPGEGVGVLVMKRLQDARQAGDHIYGVVIGSATNQDGTTSGITAPSSLSQEQLHRDVYERFDIPADSIGMIEAHGTGTKLGDPIEFQALTRAFRKDTQNSGFCALGSAKTNVGHCLTAAGVAGVIKTLLAFEHQSLPASRNFNSGNSHIDWSDSPFYVNQQTQPWQTAPGEKRRAAVSSFGFSGTNAHVVLEEYPSQVQQNIEGLSQPSIIVLSAKSKESLKQKAQQLQQWLQKTTLNESDRLSIAYTLQMCRKEMDCRMGFIATSIDEIKTQLEHFSQNKRSHYKQGEIKQGKDILSSLDEDDFAHWLAKQAYQKVLSLWVVGAKIDWQLLYPNQTPQKLRLPTYPFAKESHWLPGVAVKAEKKAQLPTELVFAQTQDETLVEPPQVIQAQPSTLHHYIPQWKVKAANVVAHSAQRQVLTIGDFGLANAKVLHTNKTPVTEQLEDYATQLLAQLKTFEGQKQPVLLQLVVQQPMLLALSGALKTAALEFSAVHTQLILVDSEQNLSSIIEQEANCPDDNIVRYQNGRRSVLHFEAQVWQNPAPVPFKEDGVYVISGGMGQLGQLFAKEILNQTSHAKIILLGRNTSPASHLDINRVHYESVDISDITATKSLFDRLIAQYGTINGIIHSAGVIKDQFISDKTADELKQVFAPKVTGVTALDEASQFIDLDFFVCFSSIVGIFGNLGQADYATANAFLDQYMLHRSRLAEQGHRRGLSLSINWPLWQFDGGMKVDEVTQSMLRTQGITPMPNDKGIEAFYQAFAAADKQSQHCFLFGEDKKLGKLWDKTKGTQNQTIKVPDVAQSPDPEALMAYLKATISGITKIAVDDLDEDVDFKDMGFDSIMSMSIMQRLEESDYLDIGELPPTLLFEISTIEQLHGYLLENACSINVGAASGLDSHQPSLSQHTTLSLSKAQEGLWLLQKQMPELSAYNVPLVFELPNVNLANMQKAIDWLCQQHPVLLTSMIEVEGRPKQKPQQNGPVVDERTTIAASRADLVGQIKLSIQQPFALNDELLWRATAWRTNLGGQSLDLMVIVFHHLIIDGVSATMILQSLWQAYHQLQNGLSLDTQAPDVGFFSYLDWEKNMLVSETGQRYANYWQNELQGELSPTFLPGRKDNPQRIGERLLLPLAPGMHQKLNDYFKQNNVNAPVFFLTVFALLIGRESNRQKITLGVPVLHRPKQDMNQSLGLFVNQLPLRLYLDKNQDFLTLAKHSQSQLLDLIDHSGYPFSEIVRVAKAPRNRAYHPIFQIGFAYHNFIAQDWFDNNQALVNAIWDDFQQDPELDLSLDVTPLPHQYRLALKFDTSVYDKAQIEQLGADYLALMDAIISSANGAVADYPQLLSPSKPTRRGTTLVALFEAQASQTPDHIAVRFAEQTLTYEQLNQKANGFAQYLLEQGIKQQSLVAISVKPSLELMIAIVGILKAGAAYVPIDPGSPQARMELILADSDPSLLILQSDSQATLNSGNTPVIYLDKCLPTLAPVEANPQLAQAENLAYIIYTSGSTGRPKGVLVEHRNVCALMQNTRSMFGFCAQDTWCLFHSYAFDFSVWEIWGALLHGGRLVIADDQTRKNTAAFGKFIVDNQITVLNQTPSAFLPLMDIMLHAPEQNHNLRYIIFGGEALAPAKLKPWFASNYRLPTLVNMYGITETTVHVTEMTVTEDLVLNQQDKSIIGKPLPGYSIYLLDENQAPVEPGQIGEIYVGGTGVARGYYKRPDLTEQRFINSSLSTGRLYRSGDLARLNQNGDFEYVGRADDQVQISGFRIELGEIQQALLKLSNINDACVFALDKQRGKVLVAYLIAPQAIAVTTLRAQLLSLLPEYMVPSYFVFVEKFPLTNNGKIDKKALAQLPLSSNTAAGIDSQSEATTTMAVASVSVESLQSRLTDIWKDVLEIDHVGIDDPFFEAGGSSILANVLAGKIESRLGIDFPLTLMFQYSTIREMADYLAGMTPDFNVVRDPNSLLQSNVDENDNPDYYESSLAIVGMSCHYPDSANHQAFWQNLYSGKDLVKRLNTAQDDDQITWLDCWVAGQDNFDPDFFKISEKNARTLSYSARQLLLHTWKAVEDAGYNSDHIANTGVYVSSSGMDTPDLNLQDKIQDDRFILNAEDYVASTLNQPGTLPTLLSYHMGFTGPSLFVHSNCSSSLSAVALASSALKAKEIDHALVGAACFYPQRYTGFQYERGLNFAKDARCKVFDQNADGMVGGNGVAVVMLKRAQDAINDADHIYSLIRGVNVNNDGKTRAGFFAPGTTGQMSVIQQALKNTGVSPQSISYVEAHGTGTSLGDPIEFAALQQVYRQSTDEKQYCGLGSVKSNLGHTDTLAGLTGLIKTVLALHHKKLPASLHYDVPNPQIDLENSPFYVVKDAKEWQTDHLPRRAAVSSFGIGGTNAHGILEEYTPKTSAGDLTQQPSIIVLSAAQEHVLAQQVTELLSFVQSNDLDEQARVRLAYTLQTGRKVMAHRTGFVVSSIEELKQQLSNYPVKAQAAHSQYQDILKRWLETGFSDWDFLYHGVKVPKMSLPTYPFALKSYPLPRVERKPAQTVASNAAKASLQFQSPVWVAKAAENLGELNTAHCVVLCEVPQVTVTGATTQSLFSSHFSLEQKIADYAWQLVEILKNIAQSKVKTLVQLVLNENQGNNLYFCLHSLLKTASLECHHLDSQIILVEGVDDLPAKLNDNRTSKHDLAIRYRQNNREVLEYQPVKTSQSKPLCKLDGVYLLTGGLGGIGSLLIEDINKQPFNKTIITTGRKPANHPQVQQQLSALQSDKATLKYYQVDVSKKQDVIRLVRDILAEFDSLDGIIHAAGIVKDQLFVNKDKATFEQVLAPKVTGVIALDEATQDLPLDFFICFGGLSGVHGAFTQIDYATANGFLDSYMQYRNNLVKNGERSGNSHSIDWPYWQNGGMKINPQFEKMMGELGISPMPSAVGINAFYQSLQQVQTLVVYEQEKQATNNQNTKLTTRFESLEQLEANLLETLHNTAADLLGMNKNDLDPNADLGDVGADSIAFVSFINQLNKTYQLDLSPTLFFKYSTINAIKDHLLDEHGNKLMSSQSVVETEAAEPQLHQQQTTSEPTPEQTLKQTSEQTKEQRIAIIGVSGEFPQAKNVDAFWQNLAQGKDCITRRNWSDENLPAETQWLGSVSTDETFDPLFFNIAPAESHRINRQDSLLMMHVWKCIEDAGYDPTALAGSNTGIFIGCQSNYYDGMVTSPAFAPNRMSYFLDLHGPSEGIDTTCSSSLVAVHKACQAIQQGDCEQAIVGGVNIIDSPKASVELHEIGALSLQGRCKTFAKDADGFVRGEGVGMIFVKRLSAAIEDKDAIYATILGSALNHGGKSQGFTVPNAKAQAMLLEKAWQDADIEPSSLSYIECHGTGTSLGDPIEVDALKDAFKNTVKTQFDHNCALGSVKSNIGHLEIAAGIAGVIKVLMQFKHKTLAPSLHVNELNPYLALDNSPFSVQTEKADWTCSGARRAAVSSFGISGVNAHLVLEEFETAHQSQPRIDKPELVLLSASSKASLMTKVKELQTYLDDNASSDERLLELAYTLQVGRPQLKYRLAWAVSGIDELKQKLQLSLKQCDIGEVDKKHSYPIADEDLLHLIETNNHKAVARLWLEGKAINWQALYSVKPQRLHLPSYPFVNAAPSVKEESENWLLLDNHWQATELDFPVNWHDKIADIAHQRILLVSPTVSQAEMLLSLLKDSTAEVLLFEQLAQAQFSLRSAPDVVFYLDNNTFEDINKQIETLYHFIQTIEGLESKSIELIYASITDEPVIAREDITALLRSYSLRNPEHQWTMIEFAGQNDWSEKLLQEWVCPKLADTANAQPNHIQYQHNQRSGLTLQQAHLPASDIQMPPFKQNGVYLIAGALGELGVKLSRCLLSQYNATLILLGRRAEVDCQSTLEDLRTLSGNVHYLSCDVAKQNDVKEVANYIEQQSLTLNGIFHLGTSFSEDESCWQDFEQSMAVKVQGSMLLDEAFAQTPLDFFVLFSSMAVFGTLNHLSYSYGNGFQNYFASKRNYMVGQRQRHGKTLALNWGYWHSDDPVKSIENSFAEKKGYSLIQMDKAFEVMGKLLLSDNDTLGVVLSHDKDKIFQNTNKLLQRKKAKTTSGKQKTIQHSTEELSVSETVISIVSHVIGIEPDELDLECDLYEYGFDSISLLKTFQQLKAQLSIDLQADAFKNMNTIQSLIDEIENLYQPSQANESETKADVTPDFILDAGLLVEPEPRELPSAYEGNVETVFLTGATGFLGSHILNQLLTTTNASIYCLVRANSIKQAQQRILQTAQSYKLSVDTNRIMPILGDMEKPRLGMSKKNWNMLCNQVQHIVHTATYVNHIQPYFAFKKSVAGTTELLSMAYTNTIKMMHFVSSTTASTQVKNSHFSVNPVEDFIDREKAELIASGYGQSKWVQEENIRLASQAGVPYTIYRFSEISGSSKTGIGNTNDIFHRILRMMLSVDVQPQDSHYLIDIIPVDMAASTIVSGMNDAKKRNRVYHVANPNPLTIADFYRYASNNDLSFNSASKDSFIAACKEYANERSDHDDQVIMQGMLTQRPGYDEYLFETYLMPMDPYHKDNFLTLVERYGVDFVSWDKLFETYFKQWKEDRYYKGIWEKMVS